MEFLSSSSKQTTDSEYLPPILPTSKLIQAKREESAKNRKRMENESANMQARNYSRKNSTSQQQQSSHFPTSNTFDTDGSLSYSQNLIPKGTNESFGHMIAEGDLKSIEQLRNRNDKTGVYNPDYISSSKQIHFYEEDNDDNTWIRVFGYNPENVSQLLTAFENCGYIAETKTSPGNFMYIRYYTQMDVEKALALNDTLLCGYYIGVIRCTSEEVGKSTQTYLNQVKSQSLDTREYMLKENEIFKKAPVKRYSICSWLTELLFGV